jgi:hypothetical protein
MVDKQFNLYQLPYQLKKIKAIKLKQVVITKKKGCLYEEKIYQEPPV